MAETRKMRIYQVAKEFNVSTEAFIEFLQTNKFKVRNHMAPLTDEMYNLVCGNYTKEDVDSITEIDFRKKLQEKKTTE